MQSETDTQRTRGQELPQPRLGNIQQSLPTAGESTRCRFCQSELRHTFVDLGMSPLCENYLTAEQLNQMEPFFPLHVHVCHRCFLVQLPEYVSPDHIFSEYAYYSSYSDSWLQHARRYV